jgi:hypothetical protein
MSLSLNWNLDLSAKAGVQLSAALLTTALSDNVQVLAVMVCERYGANLPMCQDTCDKVERLARRSRSWEVFKRTGIKIGFGTYDVVYELSQNNAGSSFHRHLQVCRSTADITQLGF